MAKSLSRKVHIYINGKEIESTLSVLHDNIVKLKNQQKKMTIGSEEYIKTSLKIKEINSVIKEQEKAIRDLGNDWDSIRDKAASYGNILMGLKTLWGKGSDLFDKLKDLAADAAALDDVYADVQKTTGLTHEEVEKLNEAERPFSSSHLLKIPRKLL